MTMSAWLLSLLFAVSAHAIVVKGSPEQFKHITPPSWGLAYDSIEVLGFSKDSKVAYLNTHPRNECGPECRSLEVKDLVKDKILATYSKEGSQDWFLNQKKINLEQELAKFGIVQKESLVFKTNPATYNSEKYEIILKAPNKVILKNEKRGEKELGTMELDERRNLDTARPIGFVKSPFEDRALVIVGSPYVGWEDSQITIVSVHTFGAHLSVGFKKKK